MNRSMRLLLVCTLAISATLACRLISPGAFEGDQTPVTNPELQVSPPAPTQTGGICENPYFPVKTGATWFYISKGSLAGDFSFTNTISAIQEEGFTLSSEFKESTRTQEWACKPEGLLALQIDNAAAAGLTTDQVHFELKTLNVTGITIPANITPGDQWEYQLELEGDMSLAGTAARAEGTASYAFTALNLESVSVPAGTFEAMKIDSDLIIVLQMTIAGISTPVIFTSTATQWLVPGIGWVKVTSTNDLEGTSYQETIELRSFHIPG